MALKLWQQPRAFIQWTDGTEYDRGFDDNAQRERAVADCVANDPCVRCVRFYYSPAPAALRQ